MKSKKQALAKSLLALLLCVAMLVSTTFAWFTDSVVSGINTIAAGNLDVELYHSNAAVSDEKVDASTKLFLDLQGNPILWEPGVVSYENLRVTNEGDLALIYQLAINTANENYILDNGAQYGLSQVLKVGVVEGGITATDRAAVVASVGSWTTLAAFLEEGNLLADGEETWGIVIYWQPSDNDNNWNANNGKQLSSGDALTIDLGVKLTATQMVSESDSFGDDYDAAAKDDVFPSFEGGTAGVPVTPDANGNTAEAVTITVGDITATVPAGVKLADGVTSLSLTVDEMAFSESNVVLGENEAMLSLNVHVEGVAADNTTPITITLPELAPVALNMGNYKVYHVEDGATNEMTLVANDADFTAHNQFKYDPATGDVTLYMASFSEVAVVAEPAAWEGNVDHTWYNADATNLEIANADQLWSFSQIVGGMNGQTRDDFAGKTVTLIANIDLDDTVDGNDKVFYPIGYYNNLKSYDKISGDTMTESSVSSFEGTFDGQGHTVSDFYQNTWEMFGDYNDGYSGTPNHYKDAMGLFGYVYGGTVKNLTVKNFSSDGEFTPTGVIAAYACNATFENIAIVNCNPRVYNTGNGGIVGIGGNSDDPESYKLTFTNITVDNTNKITALWGSWDVACGGLVGMFRGAGHAYMNNCHVGAQIDVYNDVCGNYQYYWYRYAGMMIGTNKNMVTDENGYTVPETDKYHATNCTVHFGDWNDYYYCELVANSLASYTHDHQFSRLTQIQNVSEIQNADGSWKSTGNYILMNGKEPTDTCYHIVNKDGVLVEHKHEDEGTEDVDVNGDGVVETVLKENNQRIYLPFNQLFTGYGWGVKHIPVGEFDGVRILDREVAESVVKFESKINYSAIYRMNNNTDGTLILGNLFEAVSDADINDGSVMVTLDKVYDNESVAGTYIANTSDWTQSTIQLTGKGTIKITIQDYIFCTPTVAYLIVTDEEKPAGTTGNVGSGRNELVNGDFEESALNNWDMLENHTNIKTSLTTEEVHSGAQSMLVNFINTWHKGAYQTITVEPNTEYRVSLWHKSVGNGSGTPYFLVVSGDSVDGTKLASTALPIDNTSWTQQVFTFNSGNNTQVTLFFNTWNAIGNDQYIDDIMVVPTTASFDGYITNGDFEKGDVSGWNKVDYGGWYSFTEGTLSATQQHSGGYSAEIMTTQDHTGFYQTVNVKPNTDYQIAVWQKSTNASGMALDFYVVADDWATGDRLSNKEVLANKRMSAANTTWTNHIIFFNSGDNTQVTLCFHGPSGSGDYVINQYVDDIEMAEAYVSFDGYVVNGDFEAGSLLGWNQYEYSWGTTHAKADYTIYQSHTGNGSVLVNTPDHYGYTQVVDVKPNTTYTLKFWYKSTDASARNAKVYVLSDYDVDSPNALGSFAILKSNTEWSEGTITFNSGDNTQIAITTHGDWASSGTGNAEFYLDDITVTEG